MYINRKTGERVEVKRVDEHIMAVNDGNDGWLLITMANFNEQYGEAMICQHKCPDLSDCGGNHNIPHIKNRWCAEGCFGYPCIPYIPKQKNTITFTGCTSTISAKHKYDVDNEPVFPNCGTCNARKDLKERCENNGSSWCADFNFQCEECPAFSEKKLSDDELQEPKAGAMEMPLEATKPNLLLSDGDNMTLLDEAHNYQNSTEYDEYKEFMLKVQRKLLDHLCELGIVYVSRQVKCDECDGTGEVKVWENEGEDYCMEGCVFCGSKGFYLVFIPLSDYMKGEGK
jgi:hypothetical protein